MTTFHQATEVIRVGRTVSSDLTPPVHTSAVFEQSDTTAARRAATTPRAARFYSRYSNPTIDQFESAIADLEGAEAARAYASGMGAVSGVLMALCSAGDHVVAQRQLYSGTLVLLAMLEERFGLAVTYVDGTDPDEWDAAIEPGRTVLCVAETPANPQLAIVDLERFGAIKGPVTLVDSTFATPALQRPLDFGVDLVLHSATKGIGGHNDCSVGVVAGSEELINWLWGFAILHGANASPYDAAAALRGVRTLDVRLERQCATAGALSAWLEDHPAVATVSYPGLVSHPQHELAGRQMRLPGSLVSFDLDGGLDAGVRFSEALTLARIATSLGGPETLVAHPASTTHAGLTPAELKAAGISDGTLRISFGLEHPEDLRADFAQALDAVATVH